MASIFNEQELKDLCAQFLNTRIGFSNVCSLYERAVETNSTDLENTCIEFVLKNKKQVLNSESFLAMDPLSSVQLIHKTNNR